MFSVVIRLSFALLVLNQLLLCEAFRSRNQASGKGYDAGYPKTYMGTSPGIPSQSATRRGLGISAWGIVTLIVGFILAGMGLYYFSLCYPILCRKERKYDIMKLDNV